MPELTNCGLHDILMGHQHSHMIASLAKVASGSEATCDASHPKPSGTWQHGIHAAATQFIEERELKHTHALPPYKVSVGQSYLQECGSPLQVQPFITTLYTCAKTVGPAKDDRSSCEQASRPTTILWTCLRSTTAVALYYR